MSERIPHRLFRRIPPSSQRSGTILFQCKFGSCATASVIPLGLRIALQAVCLPDTWLRRNLHAPNVPYDSSRRAHTGFFATSIRCFREGLVKDSSEDLRNRDLLSLHGRTREFTTTLMRARIERRNRKCPSRLAIRFSSTETPLKIRAADDFCGYSSGCHQGHQTHDSQTPLRRGQWMRR